MDPTFAQMVALLALAALMAAGASSGFRRGPGRQLAGPLAGVLALIVGWLAGPWAGHTLLGAAGVPWIFRGAAGILTVSAVTWLLALAVLWRMGKPTAASGEPDNPVLGALVGCWTGMLGWLVAVTAWGAADAWRRELAGPRAGSPPAWSGALAEVADLPGMGWARQLPAWPESAVRVVKMSRLVLGDPVKSQKLMQDPRVRALASHPSFYPAWGDPAVKRLVQEGRYWSLLLHPKVQPMLEDEGFQRELAGLDLEDILGKALAGE
jgi:hypothetical protein